MIDGLSHLPDIHVAASMKQLISPAANAVHNCNSHHKSELTSTIGSLLEPPLFCQALLDYSCNISCPKWEVGVPHYQTDQNCHDCSYHETEPVKKTSSETKSRSAWNNQLSGTSRKALKSKNIT